MGQLKPNSESHTYFLPIVMKRSLSWTAGQFISEPPQGCSARQAQQRCCDSSLPPWEMQRGGCCTELHQTHFVNPLEAEGLDEWSFFSWVFMICMFQRAQKIRALKSGECSSSRPPLHFQFFLLLQHWSAHSQPCQSFAASCWKGSGLLEEAIMQFN